MTDFRHPDNPEPFTALLLETETAALTPDECSAVRSALVSISRMTGEIFDRMPHANRGETARDLNLLTAAIKNARAALLRAANAERKEQQT